MKRSFICFVLAALACRLFAADIIITRESEKIEALIQEVSSTEIRYKKANNPNGPTFVIEVSKIATIIYQNGEVQAFEAPQQQAQQQQNYQQGYQQQGYQQNYGNYNSNQNQRYSQSQYGQIAANAFKDPDLLPIQRMSNSKYMYGNQMIGSDQYVQLLRERCGVAFTEYRNGKYMEGAGWGALAGGVVIMGATGWLLWPMLIVGGAFATASVPLLVVGYRKQHNSVDIYNMQCSGANQGFYSLELRLKADREGFGVALSF